MAGTTCAYEGLAAGMPQAVACVSAPAGSRGNNRTRSCIAVTAAEADPEFSPAHPLPLSPAAREIERGGALAADSAPSGLRRLGTSRARFPHNPASPADPANPESPANLASLATTPTADVAAHPAAVWCVLQVAPGHEDAMAARVARVAGAWLDDCFVLRRQALRRRGGAWRLCDEVMFPGYIFLVTDDPAGLAEGLGLLTSFAYLLNRDGAPSTLDEREVAFVRDFGGPQHTVALSRGSIEGGRLTVEEGPLKGREHLVAKVDRHKRMAWLHGGMLGEGSVRVGLEVVSKT